MSKIDIELYVRRRIHELGIDDTIEDGEYGYDIFFQRLKNGELTMEWLDKAIDDLHNTISMYDKWLIILSEIRTLWNKPGDYYERT